MPKTLSLNARTSLGVWCALGATVEDKGGYLVVRSPENPLFHWGHCLQMLSGDPSDAAGWVEAFTGEFPGVAWRAIGLVGEPDPLPWAGLGLEVEPETTLVCDGPLARTARPDGYVARPLAGTQDWAGLVALNLAEASERSESTVRFQRDTARVRRRLTETGRAGWFGCFGPDGALAASLGIVLLEEGIARYQAVLTHDQQRQRGLATHLLGVGSTWACERGARRLVIVAEADSAPARLYEAVGFRPVERAFSAYAASH